MRSRHVLAAVLTACSVLAACGSDKPATTATSATIGQASSDSTGAAGTQPAAAAGNVDCAALKLNLADLLVNWQVVIGLANSPTSEWSQIPLGHITDFGTELAGITAALGSDSDAAAALSYMSGANDIVARGLGGDATAQADLTAYMGTDIGANVGKQLPISIAYQNAGCK